MENEFVQGAVDDYQQQFSTLEIKVVDISSKMLILMVALDRSELWGTLEALNKISDQMGNQNTN